METNGTSPAIGSRSPRFTAAILGPFRDAWLAGRARLATLVAAGTEAGEVYVEAYHGTVVLSGDVATTDVRDRIVRAVEALACVVGVDDRLHVRGLRAVSRTAGDAETRLLVSSALRRDHRTSGTTIHLGSVYDGVVTLTGTAPSEAIADAAFDLVSRLPGVRRVTSEIAVTVSDVGDDADAA